MADIKKNEDMVYVTVPARDMFEQPVKISINGTDYEEGTHLVSKDLAGEINRMLKVKEAADIRVLQPKRHMESLRQLEGSRNKVAKSA